MPTLHNYDTVPYEDCPITETHPDYLCVTGRLFGINTTPPDRCRVLELGCASGGNLIPMAYYWPESTFIGIELSKKQAEEGNTLIEELQLDNINIVHSDILRLDRSIGTFDYIIAHGVFSWVPPKVQDYILKLCRILLRKNGIAYISYNTFPGWYLRLPIRDMMLHHSRYTSSAEQKMDKSVEMLRMLSKGLPAKAQGSLSEQWLKGEANKLLGISPGYLLHDYLEPNNRPLYFYEFMEKASRQKLQYIAESHLYTMLGSSLTEQAETELEKFEDLVEYEQYLDYFYMRYFRQTLVCHEELDIQRDLDVDKLRDCCVFAYLNCKEEIDLHSTTPQVFTNRSGSSFSVSHPLTKAAIVELATIYPGCYSYKDLLSRSQGILREFASEHEAADGDLLLEELFHLFLSQAVGFSITQSELSSNVTDKPQATSLARIYSRHDRCCVASAHHASIKLDAVDRYILSALTGENTIHQIETKIISKMETDGKFRRLVNQNIEGVDLQSYLQQTIYHFASHGLLKPQRDS